MRPTKSIPSYFYDPITSQQIKVMRRSIVHLQIFTDDVTFRRISLSVQQVDENKVDDIVSHYETIYQVSDVKIYKEWKRKYKDATRELRYIYRE